MTDVYDEPRPSGSRWTRVNIGEAIPGVPTPLTWSIWKPAMEHAFWWAQIRLGVASAREYRRAPVTTIALGRPAISVDVALEQIARIPGSDPDAFAEQYFGLQASTPTTSVDPLLVGRALVRAPIAVATLGRSVARAAARSEAAWSAAVSGDPLALLEDAVLGFGEAMAVHTLQGLVCQAVYDRVAARSPGAATRLVSADGDLAEAAVAADLWSFAHDGLTEAAFLARHGFHGPDEGEIASPSWRQDPTPVRAAARGWAEASDDRSPAAAGARRAHDRSAAERSLLADTRPLVRPGVRALIAAARRLVMQREVGKAAFLRYLDIARVAVAELGPDAVWCTVSELRAGRPSDAVLLDRQRRRAELRGVEVPISWTGDPTPSATRGRSGPVRGLGVSPGVVEGRARVVTDQSAIGEPIGPDEILVTATTDPSWVTVFLTAGALVIDVGGALSHGAIVARELGIPCVIGTGDGTTRIPPGALIRVDGATGLVECVT